MWTLSSGKEFKLETGTILWRRENFAPQLTDGIRRCDVACSRRNLYIIAVSTKPTIWWGETQGCVWTGQRLEHCNPLSYLSTAESCREIEGFKYQLKRLEVYPLKNCSSSKVIVLIQVWVMSWNFFWVRSSQTSLTVRILRHEVGKGLLAV